MRSVDGPPHLRRRDLLGCCAAAGAGALLTTPTASHATQRARTSGYPAHRITGDSQVIVSLADGLLHMRAERPALFVAAQMVLSEPERVGPNDWACARVQIRLRDTPRDFGSTARIQLVDGDAWVNVGMIAGQGAAIQEQRLGAGTVAQHALPAAAQDDRWHEYEIAYDGATARLSVDGHVRARVAIALRSPRFWLQLHTRYNAPGTAWGEFRAFERTRRRSFAGQ
ncbi:MAG: hypothetical protein JNK05_24140 [Myxococcales bacterium]|nr:hypothetical protein [Myxococcales bacterium]